MNRYEMISSGWWAVYDDDSGGRLLRLTKYLTPEEIAQLTDNDAMLSNEVSQLCLFGSDAVVDVTHHGDGIDHELTTKCALVDE